MRYFIVLLALLLPAPVTAMDDLPLFSSGDVSADLTRFAGENIYEWDGSWWIGGDYNKLVLRSRGEGGRLLEQHEAQLLYSRYISHFWDLRAGVRYDHKPAARWRGVVALNGLAPYGIESDISLYIGGRESLAGEIELMWPLQFTQQWVIEPYLTLGWHGGSDIAADIGGGVADLLSGLRFSYEFNRHVALYFDLYDQRLLGKTRSLVKQAGESTGRSGLKVGLRLFNW